VKNASQLMRQDLHSRTTLEGFNTEILKIKKKEERDKPILEEFEIFLKDKKDLNKTEKND